MTTANDIQVGALLQAELIETYEHGWVMVNDTHASVLLMRKNSCG